MDSEIVSHQSVGKYFKERQGTLYIANDELRSEYPEDFDVSVKLSNQENGSASEVC